MRELVMLLDVLLDAPELDFASLVDWVERPAVRAPSENPEPEGPEDAPGGFANFEF